MYHRHELLSYLLHGLFITAVLQADFSNLKMEAVCLSETSV
jgi:hypothetical protein